MKLQIKAKMKPQTRERVEACGEAAVLILRAVSNFGDCFPPLRMAATTILAIVDFVQGFKAHRTEWNELGHHLQDVFALLVRQIPLVDSPHEDLKKNLSSLLKTVINIQLQIKTSQSKKTWEKMWSFASDLECVSSLRKEFDAAVSLFQLDMALFTANALTKLMGDIRTPEAADALVEKVCSRLETRIVSAVNVSANIRTLSFPEKASWNEEEGCLSGTREWLLEDISTWADSPSDVPQPAVFLLADVAGSGKSAIAHTVARRYHEKGTLLSSFYFDRETAGKNNPDRLMTAIARDLARLDSNIAKAISAAIDAEPSLPSAQSLRRQFTELILRPLSRFPPSKSLMVVIDALDEGCNKDLLKVLREEFPLLPPSVRVFLTSRPEDAIMRSFLGRPEFNIHDIDIHSEPNIQDVGTYIDTRLEGIIDKWKPLNWPTEAEQDAFKEMAGGLFIWAATACDYLLDNVGPKSILKKILAGQTLFGDSPVMKMDELYSTILGGCQWENEEFVQGYQAYMGVIMAAETPLSASGIQSLYLDEDIPPVDHILSSLRSLLTMQPGRPIRILHLSFREFLTVRALSLPKASQYYISMQDHGQRLALRCLLTLNRTLVDPIYGTGFLNPRQDIIPCVSPDHDPEDVWYACQYWHKHLLEYPLDHLPAEVHDALTCFLSKHLLTWMEVMTSRGKFQSLQKLQQDLSGDTSLVQAFVNPFFASAVHNVARALQYMDRRVEALEAAAWAVALREVLASQDPVANTADLARSLHNLSSYMGTLKSASEALPYIDRSLSLYRELVTRDDGDDYISNLIATLNLRSSHLCQLRRYEEAERDNREALERARQCGDSDTGIYDLAVTLRKTWFQISEQGREEEGLAAISESVYWFRILTERAPENIDYRDELAFTLENLANSLAQAYGPAYPDIIHIVHEAAAIFAELAKQLPTRFNPLLASSFHNLGTAYLELNEHEPAIFYASEATKMNQTLAEELPKIYNEPLRAALCLLSNVLEASGRADDAAKVRAEADLLQMGT